VQRILKVEYDFPAHVKVSRELRDLLTKILVPDPSKRITIQGIQRHPWYCKDLPPGVAEMNDNLPSPGPGVQVGTRLHLYPRLNCNVCEGNLCPHRTA
jgi:serine/threonine-protein kinase SRK2